MAVPRYLEILKDEGVSAWNKFREESGESNPDLSGAKLDYLDLRRANLSGANLTGVELKFSDLTDAQLFYADLNGARLKAVKLIRADMRGAALLDVDTEDVDL